jgi:branched-chain amino acid transport system permease protein
MFLIWRLVCSPFGLTLMGIRESEARMRTLGYNVTLHKLISFVIAGTVAGLAGSLYAFYSTYVSVTVVQFTQSSEGFLMVIIGGVGTFFGPLLGSVILLLLKGWVSLYTDRWQIVLGTVLILVILFARNGLLGIASGLLEQRQRLSHDMKKEQEKIVLTPPPVEEKDKSVRVDDPGTATT